MNEEEPMSATPSKPYAELVERLRANAMVCRGEKQRDLPAESKAELENDAREWDEAATAIRTLSEQLQRKET
jgi:hypothetical protein